ncbi:MAG: DUF3575 domain-containing protein, partial [Muribaculaceae bacterium]|nr:DUF3575 domain-containing protein [Muribaculaceae bacterium]
LAALEKVISGRVKIPESLIQRDASYIPWDYLRQRVRESDLASKREVLQIIGRPIRRANGIDAVASTDDRVSRLQAVDGGRAWEWLKAEVFAQMRSAAAVIVTRREEPDSVFEELDDYYDDEIVEEVVEEVEEIEPVVEEVVVEEPEEEPVEEIVETPVEEPEAIDDEVRHIHLKTNIVGWAFSEANLAGEIDLCQHLSLALPVYYSAINYFSYDLKFRLFGTQPELRYWLHPDNDRFFIGAHFGIACYNFAFKGEYRYQDHNGNTPALGGGISVGYRLPISRNNRWCIEFALGCGAYGLHYDRFINEPNGRLAGTDRKTYFGLDQAAVSIAYTFDLKKR